MEELEKLELKKALYMNSKYMLSQDSLLNDIINVDFQAIDRGNYNKMIKIRSRPQQYRNNYEDQQIRQLRNGNKISLGVI